MEIYVSLFGKELETLNWIDLLEQEKIPFKYRGTNLNSFSSVNILVGFSKRKIIHKNGDKVFIIEPTRNSFPDKKKLINAFMLANLPYVHFWYYQASAPTIFLFRQDIDYVDQKGLEGLLNITKEFNIRGTYFVNISGEEEFDEKIGHLNLKNPTTPRRKEILQKLLFQGNEIGNHGYWHWVFEDFKNNYENIKKCGFYLNKLLNIKNKGFAAPGAEWNIELAKAIERNGLMYSCNGLSDGGFPYYPFLRKEKTKVLEIPFWFLCDANIRFPYERNRLKNTYLKLIDRQIKNNEPVAILGHPHIVGREAKTFFGTIFEKFKISKIPNYTLYEFAIWWEQRKKIKMSYKKLRNKLIINSESLGVLLEIIYQGNKKLIKVKDHEIKYSL